MTIVQENVASTKEVKGYLEVKSLFRLWLNPCLRVDLLEAL